MTRRAQVWRPALVAVCAFWLGATPAVAAPVLPDFSRLVEANAPAVVNISTAQIVDRGESPPEPTPPVGNPFHDFLHRYFDETPEPYDAHSLGSGFLVSADGYILTSAHVIERASEISVRLADRREFKAKVIGSDPRSDVALIKIAATRLPKVRIGDPAKLRVGDWVLAIGSPFGFDSSATVGIVSAKGRSLPNENYVPFIQTDAAINPGNSGGPLFNLDGQVVGINAQIFSRTGGFMGLSFAIPIDLAMQVADQLKKTGHVTRGWLGVSIQNVTRELGESFGLQQPAGALVTEILADSPAARSELQAGDVILEFNGRPIAQSADLPPLVARAAVGEAATLKYLRRGQLRTTSIRIAALPERNAEAAAPQPPGPAGAGTLLGLTVNNLSAAERRNRGIEGGVLVEQVGPGAGSRADLRRGDVIQRIDGKSVADVKQLREQVAALPKGRRVPVLVRRGAGALFLAVQADE